MVICFINFKMVYKYIKETRQYIKSVVKYQLIGCILEDQLNVSFQLL
jgi:hypothetical protein